MKKVILEFDLVLENSKLKEDMGIESLIFSKCSFNVLDVEYFRESFDSDGEIENYTVAVLRTGLSLCLDIPYVKFKKLFTKIIENE